MGGSEHFRVHGPPRGLGIEFREVYQFQW